MNRSEICDKTSVNIQRRGCILPPYLITQGIGVKPISGPITGGLSKYPEEEGASPTLGKNRSKKTIIKVVNLLKRDTRSKSRNPGTCGTPRKRRRRSVRNCQCFCLVDVPDHSVNFINIQQRPKHLIVRLHLQKSSCTQHKEASRPV